MPLQIETINLQQYRSFPEAGTSEDSRDDFRNSRKMSVTPQIVSGTESLQNGSGDRFADNRAFVHDEGWKDSHGDAREPQGPELDAGALDEGPSSTGVDREHRAILDAKNVFVKEEPVVVQVKKAAKSTRHFRHILTYEIELQHAGYFWFIRRTYQQIRAWYRSIFFYDMSLRITGKIEILFPQPTSRPVLPDLPNKWRPSKDNSDPNQVDREKMEAFLQAILRVTLWLHHRTTLQFIEVSAMSFLGDIGEKGKEMVLKKLSGRVPIFCLFCHTSVFCASCSHWKERWVVLKDTYFLYMNMETGHVANVLLMDQDLVAELYQKWSQRKRTIVVKNSTRDLILKFSKAIDLGDWVKDFERITSTTAAEFISPQPYGSFAPIRQSTPAKWFIDGCDYMRAVGEAMEAAQAEIFIADWFLSPEIYMKRPIREGERWRLDRILQRKAEAGVKIYVLLYKEVPIALGINSFYASTVLSSLHANIKVIRHPDLDVLLWSHHEKIVIIDQKIAFVAGIDLCYGRWDNADYHLTDLGTVDGLPATVKEGKTGEENEPTSFKQGKIKAKKQKGCLSKCFGVPKTVVDPDTPKIDQTAILSGRRRENIKSSSPVSRRHRMVTKGAGIGYAVRHKRYRQAWHEMKPKHFQRAKERRLLENENEITEADLDKLNITSTDRLWLGKDYCNEVRKAFVQPNDESPLEDVIDRTKVPRMPWHDAGVVILGRAAMDVGRHFIQRWNACKVQKCRWDETFPFLVPKPYSTCPADEVTPDGHHLCQMQVVRSVAAWSVGIRKKMIEDSIHKAYIGVIQMAQHFIYIENQFFITLNGHKEFGVRNMIGEALYERIKKAFENGETFRVFVIIPMKPGIEGEYGTNRGAAVQAVTHWNYQSICRGGHSLIERLKAIGADPEQYLSFCGMRQHGMLNDQLVTELIYVHSKLMIVDDIYAIIGTANINDRSMIGKRDSEVAVVIKDTEFEESVLAGKPYQAGKFSGGLRRQLMKIHLGLLSDPNGCEIVRDVMCDEFFLYRWKKTAQENEDIFVKVFACLPSDKVADFKTLKEWEEKEAECILNQDEAKEHLKGVRGYLCKLPLDFLKDESLTPTFSTLENYLPSYFWT